MAQSAKEPLAKQVPLSAAANPYKARKVWPPNFKELNHQQQLRFEKKYKRRILLASKSPRWEKGIKFAQLATIAGTPRPCPVATEGADGSISSRLGMASILFRV